MARPDASHDARFLQRREGPTEDEEALLKTLVYSMQSGGASFVTWGLAQRPGTIAVLDLFCREEAPPLDEEGFAHDVILKCVINTAVPLERQIERFRPDRLVLVTRNIDDLTKSLATKRYRDLGGSMEAKLAVYRNTLLRDLALFDQVISYERFAAHAPEMHRTVREVVEFSKSRSAWCREFFGHKWAVGGLRDSPARRNRP
jgi:hypothetical protein